ncbi:MAG: tRNA (adenosine(37)-N6)-dimethylallyltransferase MiaA [Candidatus Gracilibacteria bacterium]|nr:tRNA (adenosine(37)-N6)-dimethylallyltransferase MiaA [Candidatus Gracilibacteria bacterium]MDD2908458.1 tRNA (adenosine(37)-N6)-dimethylallyltransferase MiaA [Candidatus Gracilibacteria bacterium]
MNPENLENFLNKKTKLPKIIIIYGPTACGKTALSIDIARKLETEIIGADSRQIYKLLDIGTGKIKEEEKKGIKHHMIDFLNIDEEYSVGEYKKEAERLILEIHNKGKIPVICGGTGLYLDSIAFNFDIPEIKPDWVYREELEKIRLEKGNEFIWKMLEKIDSEYANELEINNHRYVIRGLEIFSQTGKSKKELKKKLPPKYDILFITPYDGDRQKLYSRINSRIEEMFSEGLLEEVNNILAKGYSKTDFGLNTIGYKEIITYLEGNITIEESKDLIKQHNRNYAKRQLTWFRKYENYK